MDIILANVWQHRQTCQPDSNSYRQRNNLMQQLVDLGAKQDEVEYIIRQVYSQRVKKYEDGEQFHLT
jgi:hypothetical protein